MSERGDASVPPAGWYPDPWEPALQRWWDGRQWTGEVSRSLNNPLPPGVVPPIPESHFWSDFKASADLCLKAPWLLVATLAVEVIPASLNAVGGPDSFGVPAVLGVLIDLGTIGFYGTQRVWLLRLSRGKGLSVADVFRLTRDYFRRFFGLGVRVFLAPFLVVALIGATTRSIVATLAASAVVGYVLDVLLTFVIPDLTFKSASPHEAWESGRALLRQSWPRSRWYVLAPGIALLSISHALAAVDRAVWAAAVASAIGGPLALVFRGTVLAYYLRLRPDTPDYQVDWRRAV